MLKNKKIILASSSPRRKELFEKYKIDFIIDFQKIDEVLDESLALPLRLEKLAYQKALPISKKYPHDIVIGCDTMVCFENKMLGKAKNRQEAFKMLKMLANHTQTVYSAVAIFDDGDTMTFHDKTYVTFKQISNREIEDYLDTNEWIGKAGAYAVQGIARQFVKKIDGDIETVIGMPVKMILDYLNKNE